MRGQLAHGMLPRRRHDEEAREGFCVDLATHIARHVAPALRAYGEGRVAAQLASRHGRPPDRVELRRELAGRPPWQAWSALKRTAQEMLFDTVGEAVERQLPRLTARARSRRKAAALRLDPALRQPRYVTAVDIHCMPGGYHSEITADDVYAGALFDRGVYLYGGGGLGPSNDDMGASLADWLRRTHPGFQPRTILDMGCAAGASTVPYVRTFPRAQVHAIDVAAPMLRYAAARAASLGASIEFSQQNAEATSYPDASFDLVVSHILTHETSARALPRIVAECRRLLRRGGLMVHLETDWATADGPYPQVLLDWETHFNAEPFKTALDTTDLAALARAAGFAAADVFLLTIPSLRSGARYYHGRWRLFGAWR